MPEVKVNGVRLHYEEAGAGAETIVFAHGLFWSGRMYDAQVAHLQSRYRCVAFDFRGQGRSEVTERGYDMETLTDDTAALIAALGCAPCHFVGLSMGGFVGMRLAARRPDLVRSLVLVETAADPEPRRNLPKYRLMMLGARLFGIRPFVGEAMRAMFGRKFLRDRSRAALREEMRRRLLAVDLSGGLRSMDAVMRRRPVEEELSRITVPTLVLSGDQDRSIVTARSRRTADRIKDARLVVIPGAGHTSTVEEPEAINRELELFFTARNQQLRN